MEKKTCPFKMCVRGFEEPCNQEQCMLWIEYTQSCTFKNFSEIGAAYLNFLDRGREDIEN